MAEFAPPPPGPPPPPVAVVQTSPERSALLGSIQGFNKGGLKKTVTKDTSAPLSGKSSSSGGNVGGGASRGPPVGAPGRPSPGLGMLGLQPGQFPKLRPVDKSGPQLVSQTNQAKTVQINRSSAGPVARGPGVPMKGAGPMPTKAASFPTKGAGSPAPKAVAPAQKVTNVPVQQKPAAVPVKAAQPSPAQESVADLSELDDLLAELGGGSTAPKPQAQPPKQAYVPPPKQEAPKPVSAPPPKQEVPKVVAPPRQEAPKPVVAAPPKQEPPKPVVAAPPKQEYVPPKPQFVPQPKQEAPKPVVAPPKQEFVAPKQEYVPPKQEYIAPVQQYTPPPRQEYVQEEEDNSTCAFCGSAILEGSAIQALNKMWHMEHFKCHQCRGPLPEQFYALQGQPYCNNCYYSKFTCHKCNRPIKDEYMTNDGQVFHPECLAKKCDKCSRPILATEQRILALDQTFHSHCFSCSSCGRELSTNFYEKDNRPLCESCAYKGESKPPSRSSFGSAKACDRCHNDITGRYIEAIGKNFHPECLRCHNCDRILNDELFEREGKLTCATCMHQCTRCGRSILGSFVSAFGGEYHQECFKCYKCGTVLEDYYEVDGKAACERCS